MHTLCKNMVIKANMYGKVTLMSFKSHEHVNYPKFNSGYLVVLLTDVIFSL